MADPQVSPISQLLYTLGITRDDLNKRSDQMRQFLTADDSTPTRSIDRDNGYRSRSNSDLRSGLGSSSASSSMARSISRTSSNSIRDSTPPITPIKTEASEGGLPSRPYDSMEMVIERQRRHNKKERRSRRDKEREVTRSIAPVPPSPSPSNASTQPSVNLDSFMLARDGKRAYAEDSEDDVLPIVTQKQAAVVPVTPQKNRYYREHTQTRSASQPQQEVTHKTEASSTTPVASNSHTQSTSYYQYHPYSAYGDYQLQTTPAQIPQASSSTLPVTPQTNRIHAKPPLKLFKSPLPTSSPPASSPVSSPTRAVNLVSSPGPIGPCPVEDDYDKLPYTLPPGPYSTSKPELSYAALVGQAILSSPEHRLTLQEIYDWITIVYPYFKRGETTWMNSIRHVLSTTVCFRKVPRDRSIGRTQWAIWDEDLECFKDGNFRKQFCQDYIKEVAAKEKHTKGKSRVRKASNIDELDTRKSKRARKDQPSSPVLAPTNVQYSNQPFAPLFPPTRPTPHHQPYYQTCLDQPQTLPAEIIFPPLPAASAFNRVLNRNAMRNETMSPNIAVQGAKRAASPAQARPSSFSSSPTGSSSSVPGLTPNRHSSSSPSMPATSDADIDGLASHVASTDASESSEDVLPLSGSTLRPVRFWGELSKTNGLEPGINLLDQQMEDDDGLLKSKTEAQRAASGQTSLVSPTLGRRIAKAKEDNTAMSQRPISPVLEAPSTPPRRPLLISSVRTPISHKGLHMSPSSSLAHYKSHLDPPPAFDPNVPALDTEDALRTPRKRKESGDGLPGNPVTPRKLIFNPNPIDSPFRTPNDLGTTPRSRSIFDPHDPRTLLDDELNRMGSLSDSPVGLFGKSRSSLLYDSPGTLDAPAKYGSWW